MTIAERIRNHPAVDELCKSGGDYGVSWFCYLKPGWTWSEQTCFGDEDIRAIWLLVKQAKKVN